MRIAKIKIQTIPWTGIRQRRPKITEEVLLFREGDILNLHGLSQHYQFKITNISGGAADVEPIGKSPAPIRIGGGINFKEGIKKTRLTIGQSIGAAVPTTGVGVRWKIVLVSIEGRS